MTRAEILKELTHRLADPLEYWSLKRHRRKNVMSFWTDDNRRFAESIFRKIQAEEQAGLSVWNERGQYAKEIYTTFPEVEQLFKGTLGSFGTEYASY